MMNKEKILDLVNRFPYAIISIMAFITYAQTLAFGWVMLDDKGMIEEIVKLYPGLSSLPNAFIHEYASFFRPMQILIWALESFIGENSPFIYHLVNVILHSLVSVIVYYLFIKLSYSSRISLIIALIFSVHPLFTHAVAWIPSRGDLLLSLFGLLSYLYFLKYKDNNKIKLLLMHSLLFILALFSKETAAILPLIMLIYLIISKEKIFSPQYINLYIIWLFSIGLWYFVRSFSVSGDIPSEVFGIGPLLSNISIIPELAWKLFLPINLSTLPGFSLLGTIAGSVVLLGLIILPFTNRVLRKNSMYFGILWFLLFLLPALLFRLPHADIYYDYFEHRSYFASIGLLIYLAELLSVYKDRISKKVLNYSAAGLIILLFILTNINAVNYRNGVKFWLRGAKTNPDRPMIYNGLAVSLQEAGKTLLAEKTLLRSLEIDSNVFDTHNRLARFYYNENQKEKSLKHFYKTYRLRPDWPGSIVNLSVVLRELGRHEESANILKNALSFDSNNIIYYQNIVDSYITAKKFDSAYKYLQLSQKIGAEVNPSKFLLEWADHLYKQNDLKAAIVKAKQVIDSDPKNIDALNRLGIYEARQKHYSIALAYWENALQINPKYLPALQNFYKYYMSGKMYDKALIYAELIQKSGGKIPENEIKKLRGGY